MFLRNHWYAAAWSSEITHNLLGRILLNEPIVFFRTESGAVSAMQDRCPHRGFPLSKGRLIGDSLECGYHGLTFNCVGQCVRIPGQPNIPAAAHLRTYPVVERHGFVWIWMGDPARADPTAIFDAHWLDDPAWDARGERLHVNCDYKLIIDNLLDLGHITFVHPHTLGSVVRLDEVEVKNTITETSVVNERWLTDIAPPPTYARGNFKGNVDRWQITNFEPPACLGLDAGAAATGTGGPNSSEKIGVHTFNILTPETEKSTHYYWAIAQDRRQGGGLTDGIFQDIQKTVQEDLAVFTAHQRSLDLMPDAPMLAIKADAALLAVRRILDRLFHLESLDGLRKQA
jgi:vanillate O-demethylase monooxygenase subunit